jgi:hypothetical protein
MHGFLAGVTGSMKKIRASRETGALRLFHERYSLNMEELRMAELRMAELRMAELSMAEWGAASVPDSTASVHVGYARYLAMAGCAVISSMLSSAMLHSSIHIRCFRPDSAAKKRPAA